MACYPDSNGNISCTFQPSPRKHRIHSTRRISNATGITTGENTLPQPRVGIVVELNQLRDLMREFMAEVVTDEDNNIYAWPFETFLQWLRQRQRQSVVATAAEICQCEVYQTCDVCRGTNRDFSYDYEGRDPMYSAGED